MATDQKLLHSIEERIERAQSFTQGMKLPAQARIVIEINKEASGEDPDLRKITDLVSRDVALSAEMIKTINSPLFGLRVTVTSITQAMTLMGLNNFRKVVLASQLEKAIVGGARREAEAKLFRKFWEHFMGVAKAAELLAKSFPKLGFFDIEDEAFLAGLFHDCGIPLLIQKNATYVDECFNGCGGNPDLLRAMEIERFGFDHAVLSYVMASSWGVEERITQAILLHHDRETLIADQEVRKVWTLLRLADYLSEYEAQSRHAQIYECSDFSEEYDRIVLPEAIIHEFRLSYSDLADLKEYALDELGQYLKSVPLEDSGSASVKKESSKAVPPATVVKKKSSWF